MPASEVAQRAQEAGLELDIAQVNRIRERERQRSAKANPPAPAPPADDASDDSDQEDEDEEADEEEAGAEESAATDAPGEPAPKRRGRKPGGPDTKAGFVRSLPLDLPAKDVVARAQQKGFELTEAYVSAIRSKLKQASSAAPAGKRRGRRKGSREAVAAAQAPVAAAAVAQAPARAPSAAAPPEPVFTRDRTTEVEAVEVEFATLVLEIGLVRAEQLLAQLKERVTLLVRGRLATTDPPSAG